MWSFLTIMDAGFVSQLMAKEQEWLGNLAAESHMGLESYVRMDIKPSRGADIGWMPSKKTSPEERQRLKELVGW